MLVKKTPSSRDAWKKFLPVQTRWEDNDAYGHVNNVVYYSYFDSSVNRHLISDGGLDLEKSPVIGLCVDSGCSYFSPVGYPQELEAGLRVAHLGRSSVRYEVGIFVAGAAQSSAEGHFVHVFVDRATRKPVEIPAAIRACLVRLQVQVASEAAH
ncbi:MAG: thioesterase family protein [Archangium sp.]